VKRYLSLFEKNTSRTWHNFGVEKYGKITSCIDRKIVDLKIDDMFLIKKIYKNPVRLLVILKILI